MVLYFQTKTPFQQYFSEDFYLFICHFLSTGLFEIKFVRLMLFGGIFWVSIVSIFQGAYFIYKFDLHYFAQYGASYFWGLYVSSIFFLSLSLPRDFPSDD